jgi:hypothetical protein
MNKFFLSMAGFLNQITHMKAISGIFYFRIKQFFKESTTTLFTVGHMECYSLLQIRRM